nr:MAG TPA: hypothetical protein [Bacteriophage sp.]
MYIVFICYPQEHDTFLSIIIRKNCQHKKVLPN